jgi:hypothetical protein
MDIQERIKFLVNKLANGKYTVFSKNCGIPVSTFKIYVDGPSNPTSGHLRKIASVYRVNLNWLILGEGDPFVGGVTHEGKIMGRGKFVAIDPVLQLLNEEEERAGIALTPEQRIAILKILRELIDRDVRSIRELLSSIQIGKKEQKNDTGQD